VGGIVKGFEPTGEPVGDVERSSGLEENTKLVFGVFTIDVRARRCAKTDSSISNILQKS
jgi:hypothetical protein